MTLFNARQPMIAQSLHELADGLRSNEIGASQGWVILLDETGQTIMCAPLSVMTARHASANEHVARAATCIADLLFEEDVP